jgi:hypoxanthine phosphoribosyltransferase
MLHKDIEEVLVSQDEIKTIIKTLGATLTEDYAHKKPLFVGLLKGCVPFISDLLKVLDFMLEVDFMDVSSYHGGLESSGDVKIDKDLSTAVKGRHVILAEDIVDSGRTIQAIRSMLLYRGAASVRVVTLLDKPKGRVVELQPDYIGRTIPDAFVVGYGLDYKEFYRNLPYVGTLKPSVYQTENEES